ncbi:hypothetical protein ACSU1N_03615 [Thermogladius sp. 4427co]|uniref:hypothetical protein n=1 Tax=Thermogladius sp. 4427co TaxID=3450718 RepID=UPI003F7A09B6
MKTIIKAFARNYHRNLLIYVSLLASIVFLIQLFLTPVESIAGSLGNYISNPSATPAQAGVLEIGSSSLPVVVYCFNNSSIPYNRTPLVVLASDKLASILGSNTNGSGNLRLQVGGSVIWIRIGGFYNDYSFSLKTLDSCSPGTPLLGKALEDFRREVSYLEAALTTPLYVILFAGSLILGVKQGDGARRVSTVLLELGASRRRVILGFILSLLLTSLAGLLVGLSIAIVLSHSLIALSRVFLGVGFVLNPYIDTGKFLQTATIVFLTTLASQLGLILELGRDDGYAERS